MIYKTLKNSTFLIFILLSQYVLGQELFPKYYDTTVYQNQIEIVGNAFQHSSSLQNHISRKFLFGGEIERSFSEKAYKRLKKVNQIGGGYRLGIEYRSGKKIFDSQPDWGWMINIANEAHFSGEFSNDLFGLAFLGNEAFLGKSVEFSGQSARFEQYWSLGGGIHNKKTKSFLTLNVILPQNFFEAKIQKGNMTFSESVDYVEILADGELLTANSYPTFKGLGGAVNFDVNVPFGNPESFHGVIGVVGRNVGGYYLRQGNRTELNLDLEYAGFSLNEIINGGINEFVDSLGITESQKSAFKLLPGFFQVGKIVTTNTPKKAQSFFGVRMYLNRTYQPMIYGGVHYQVKDNFSFGGQGSFGGYGLFRLGLYANYTTEKMIIGIGTEDVLGAVLKTQFGHSVLIRGLWRF